MYPNFIMKWAQDFSKNHPELFESIEEDPNYRHWRYRDDEIGGYGFHSYQNLTEQGNIMYQWLKYDKMDGLEFVSKNFAINEDKIFRILPKTGHFVLLKRTSGALNSSCYNQTKVVYNNKTKPIS